MKTIPLSIPHPPLKKRKSCAVAMFKSILPQLPLPAHPTEDAELKYVRSLIRNNSVPNAFDSITAVLSKTKHDAVHKEICMFVLRCLQNPLDIAECMENDIVLTKSLSGSTDSFHQKLNKPRLRRSYSSLHIETRTNNENGVSKTNSNKNDQNQDVTQLGLESSGELWNHDNLITEKENKLNSLQSNTCDYIDPTMIDQNQSSNDKSSSENQASERSLTHSTSVVYLLPSYHHSKHNNDALLSDLLDSIPKMIPYLTKEECYDFLSYIPNIFVDLAPDIQVLNARGIPKFEYFKHASACARKIVHLYFDKIIEKSDVLHFAKTIIMASFQCSANLMDIKRMTKMKTSTLFSYLAEFIPFIASFIPVLDCITSSSNSFNINLPSFTNTNDNNNNFEDFDDINGESGMILLLQQFWISLIVQTSGDFSNFAKYFRELKTLILFLPPFFSASTPISYETLSGSIEDFLAKIKFNLYHQKREELIQAFCDIATTINAKTLAHFPTPDLVLLLSIAILEKIRSSFGKLVPMLDYFEVEFYPEFSRCLDAILQPAFNEYLAYLTSIQNANDYIPTLYPVIKCMFEKYVSNNPRILPFIEKVMPSFVTSHRFCLVSLETLNAYVDSFIELRKEDPSRLAVFKDIGLKLFENAVNAVPYAFIDVSHSLIVNTSSSKYYTPDNRQLSVILELLPKTGKFALQFTSQLATESKMFGALPYLDYDKILNITNTDDRLLFLSFYFLNDPKSTSITNTLISTCATPDVLMMVWSHVVMTPGYNSHVFMKSLIGFFNQLASANQGIFNLKTIDLEFIIHQSTMLRFFNEQMLLKHYSDDIVSILPPLFSKKINCSPATCAAIFPLACLVASTLTMQKTTLPVHTSLIHYLIKLSMIAISYRTMPKIFKYINNIDVSYLEQGINYVPIMLQNSTLIDNTKTLLEDKENQEIIGQESYKTLQSLDEIVDALGDPLIYQKLGNMLAFLLANIRLLFLTFFEPNEKHYSSIQLINRYYIKPRNYNMGNLLQFFWLIYPTSIPSIIETLDCSDQILPLIPPLSTKYPESISSIPLIMAKISPESLEKCDIVEPDDIFILLTPTILGNEASSKYVSKCLENFDANKALFYIPQFVQSIPFDKYHAIADYLVHMSEQSDIFYQYLLWNLTSEKNRLAIEDKLTPPIIELETRILKTLNEERRVSYDNELQFINDISSISRELLPLQFEDRKKSLIQHLADMKCPKNVFIPSNPEYSIIEIDALHSIPLKSHSRVPILVNFKAMMKNKIDLSQIINQQGSGDISKSPVCLALKQLNIDNTKPSISTLPQPLPTTIPCQSYPLINPAATNSDKTGQSQMAIKYVEPSPVKMGCIFKIEDDVRMDVLMIQLINKMKSIFDDAGIDCFLLSYNIFATGPKRGVIEVIKNAKSRHEIGVLTKLPLIGYFQAQYGEVGSPAFRTAQRNFIKSLAPYSLFCYLFQVKDRHNANIMLDADGHIIHIDFGFVFDISPGGNMKFEKAPFKLNNEMIQLMGGSKTAPPFIKFQKLFVKCFLALRSRFEEIQAIAYLMKDAGFNCFRHDSFYRLRERFFLDKSDTELQSCIDSLISSAMNAVTTTAYDAFQLAQNGIFYI